MARDGAAPSGRAVARQDPAARARRDHSDGARPLRSVGGDDRGSELAVVPPEARGADVVADVAERRRRPAPPHAPVARPHPRAPSATPASAACRPRRTTAWSTSSRRRRRAIDDQLVLASRLPFRQRHKTLLGLRYRIIDIERDRRAHRRASAIEAASPLVDGVDDSIARINDAPRPRRARPRTSCRSSAAPGVASLSPDTRSRRRIWSGASACSARRRAMTRRHSVSSAPSKIDSTRASTK